MLKICRFILIINNRGCLKVGKSSSCNFSSTSIAKSVWNQDDVAPMPDRQFYYENPPVEGDSMYTVNVKAAPSRYFYSVFHDPVVEKFEKQILKKGRGDLAHSIMRDTMRRIKHVQLTKYHSTTDLEAKLAIELNPYTIFHQAIQNATPAMSLKSSQKGAAKFQIPVPVPDKKRFFMACKWILEHCRSGKPNTPMSVRLAKELLLAYDNEGTAVKRKQDLHRQVMVNRAYIHMRWK